MQKSLYQMGEGDVYRPPSEAHSLIIRATIGCSWNKCTFCGMFRDRKYRECTDTEILQQIDQYLPYYAGTERVFIADGNSLMLSNDRLKWVIRSIRKKYNHAKRFAIYGGPQDILAKKQAELEELRTEGLGIIYLGLESGSDVVLKKVKKGAVSSEMVAAAEKVRQAGIKLSVIAIAGLGGKELSKKHAERTGKILSAMKPDYIGILTLMLVDGTQLAKDYKAGRFVPQDERGILEELQLIVENLELRHCVFRANHASNYLPIGGTLPEEKRAILDMIVKVKNNQIGQLRPEWARGL